MNRHYFQQSGVELRSTQRLFLLGAFCTISSGHRSGCLSKCHTWCEFVRGSFLSVEVCPLDGIISILILNFSSDDPLLHCQACVVNLCASSYTDLLFSSAPQSFNSSCSTSGGGVPLSLSDKLRRRISNE